MKNCELCKSPAATFCVSDEASLCWDCDGRVHGANFLVARHSRNLLCNSCHSVTPWTASGGKLGRAVSVCETCVENNRNVEVRESESASCSGNDVTDDDEVDEETDVSDDDDDEEEEDGENQVVPWSSSTTPPPAASSTTSEDSASEIVGKRFPKRMREDNDPLDLRFQSLQEDANCCSSKMEKSDDAGEVNAESSLPAPVPVAIQVQSPSKSLKRMRR